MWGKKKEEIAFNHVVPAPCWVLVRPDSPVLVNLIWRFNGGVEVNARNQDEMY